MAFGGLGERWDAPGDDRFDLILDAAEFEIGKDRGSFERQLARNLEPSWSEVMLWSNADCDRTWDAVCTK